MKSKYGALLVRGDAPFPRVLTPVPDMSREDYPIIPCLGSHDIDKGGVSQEVMTKLGKLIDSSTEDPSNIRMFIQDGIKLTVFATRSIDGDEIYRRLCSSLQRYDADKLAEKIIQYTVMMNEIDKLKKGFLDSC